MRVDALLELVNVLARIMRLLYRDIAQYPQKGCVIGKLFEYSPVCARQIFVI